MQWPKFCILMLIACLSQAGPVELISVNGVKPDLFLILLVFFAWNYRGKDAIIASFAIGFAADILSSSIGPRIISYGLIGSMISNLDHLITLRKSYYQSTAVFAAGVLSGILILILTYFREHSSAGNIWEAVLWRSIYSGLLAPLIFLPAGWLMGVKTKH